MPSTFENQSKLPRLPIPDLEHTAKMYLESCIPHLDAKQYDEYSQIVQDFIQPNGLGQTLQKRLIEYDKTQKNSWLEAWWLKYAYLTWRTSCLVHSNWFVLAQNHPHTPKETRYQSGFSEFQTYRAAGFTTAFLNYKELIDTEQLPPDTTKQGPLDMSQYQRMFGITRVPKPECDILVGSHPCKAQHIIVMVKDQIFVVFVYDTNGARLSVNTIQAQFKECIKKVETSSKLQPPIGLLSGQHRDKWAEHHGHLLNLDRKNQESFHWIETAIFAVCLDDHIVPPGVSYLGQNVFHGFNGHNRWVDKSLSIVVSTDGRAGVFGEHSPCDALVPAYVVEYAAKSEPVSDPANAARNPTLKPIQPLSWVVDSKIEAAFPEAQKEILESIGDSEVQVMHYKGYGSDFIKKVGKVSPDAYAQLCIQLTFYRMHGYTAGVYETAATRKYLAGRTETCRSLTPAAQQFVHSFENPLMTPQQKYELFKKAASAHVKYIATASDGQGVDRHLLGLKLCLKPGESHQIFTHPVFAQSSKWQLSTSALFSGDYLDGTGFGTVYPDGYGMNYMIGSKMIKIGVESKFHDPHTSTRKFVQTLQQVYEDVGKMCQAVNSPSAKL